MHPFGKEKKTRQLLQSEPSLIDAEQFTVSNSVQKGGMKKKSANSQGLVVMNVTNTVKTSLYNTYTLYYVKLLFVRLESEYFKSNLLSAKVIHPKTV